MNTITGWQEGIEKYSYEDVDCEVPYNLDDAYHELMDFFEKDMCYTDWFDYYSVTLEDWDIQFLLRAITVNVTECKLVLEDQNKKIKKLALAGADVSQYKKQLEKVVEWFRTLKYSEIVFFQHEEITKFFPDKGWKAIVKKAYKKLMSKTDILNNEVFNLNQRIENHWENERREQEKKERNIRKEREKIEKQEVRNELQENNISSPLQKTTFTPKIPYKLNKITSRVANLLEYSKLWEYKKIHKSELMEIHKNLLHFQFDFADIYVQDTIQDTVFRVETLLKTVENKNNDTSLSLMIEDNEKQISKQKEDMILSDRTLEVVEHFEFFIKNISGLDSSTRIKGRKSIGDGTFANTIFHPLMRSIMNEIFLSGNMEQESLSWESVVKKYFENIVDTNSVKNNFMEIARQFNNQRNVKDFFYDLYEIINIFSMKYVSKHKTSKKESIYNIKIKFKKLLDERFS